MELEPSLWFKIPDWRISCTITLAISATTVIFLIQISSHFKTTFNLRWSFSGWTGSVILQRAPHLSIGIAYGFLDEFPFFCRYPGMWGRAVVTKEHPQQEPHTADRTYSNRVVLNTIPFC